MKKIFLHIFAVSMVSLTLATSCRDEDFDSLTYGDDAIRIGAKVEMASSTRSYIASGPVNNGKFILTYPYYYTSPDAYGMYRYQYHYGDVTFGYQGEETTGFVNVGTATAPKYLVWSPTNTGTSTDDGIFVYPSSKPSPLVLDNFMYRATQNTSGLVDSIVDLTSATTLANFQNPFKPGIFDDVEGTNDLLWGKTTAKTGTQHIDFDMSHRMTRLVLNVVVEPNNSPTPDTETLTIDLSNASVTITKILLEPLTYRRLYGDLLFQKRINAYTIADSINRNLYNTEMKLVRSSSDPDYDTESVNGLKYQWANVSEDDDHNVTYTTQDFVFVPQILRQGTDVRPRIVIAVPARDVNNGLNTGYGDQDSIYFSGNIPVTMKMDNGDGLPESLQTLNFDPGKVITLTTKMKPGEMELEFAPVTVEPWVYKGTFYPSAKQSGIYTTQDLYDLIPIYNAGDSFWMRKYGYIPVTTPPGTTWTFMINTGSLEFDAYTIVGSMMPGKPTGNAEMPETPPFNFNFRSREEFYIMPDGTKVSMGILSSNLYDIVTTPRNTGVKTTDDFSKLISAYQRNFWQQFIYGDYSKDTENWTFNINQSITLDYDVISASMIPPENGLRDFVFNFDPGVTVTVNNMPTGAATQTVDTDRLLEIVTNRIPGIYTSADFMNLISAIKSNSTDQLAGYGNQSGGTWTFTLKRDIELDATDLQGALNTSALNNYAFNFGSYEVSLSQYLGAIGKPTPAQLVKILKLKKPSGVADADAFYALVQAYNQNPVSDDTLSQYGYYMLSGSWTFYLTENMTLDKTRIQGKMVPGNGKPAFSIFLNYKVLKFEGETGDGMTGIQGAEELYEILTATTDPDPAP